jgi:hypothetical protein
MSGPAQRGVLRVGDRVRFEGGVHEVVALEGTTVRLVSGNGVPWIAAAGHLMATPDFEVVNGQASVRNLRRLR